MKRFLQDIFAPATAGAYGRAEWTLHWLLAAALVLPVTIFIVGAAISYREHEAAARDRLQRNLGVVYENAVKVIETIELTQRYLDELFEDVTNDQVRANEAEYNRRLKALTDTLPQFADIWLIDPDGHPLVSGTVYPMPPMDLSDRNYFRAQKNGEVNGNYVSEVIQSRATNQQGQPHFFAVSRKRLGKNGEFLGVTTISIAPEYFTDYYAALPPPVVAALIREDGYVLARYPTPINNVERLSQQGPFMARLREQVMSGQVEVRSAMDDTQRWFAFRKLPRLPAYVTTGVDVAAIRAAWLDDMSRHLIFGIPATAAMVGLALMALRRTRREATANEMLRAEIARREATEEALRQAQKMEAVGRLTGGIAHDFNNLLTAIIGNLDLALRRLDGQDRVRGWLANCRQASDRAATLVQRLLAFSRQHPLEVKSVDINRLVQGMSELLGRSIGETVKIETVLAGGLWSAAIDPNQLENAIVNLVVNARDAMPEGGRLTIETANCHLDETYVEGAGTDVAPGQYVMVAVSDSGSGMTREVIDRAFEPFFTTKPTGVGTGLGLSQVYGFVKQSGGHIRIYSEIGVGTTIKLYFQRLTQTDVPLWTAREAVPGPTPSADGTELVLVVEDDAQVNKLAVEALQERGYQVISASDGASALRLIEATPQIDLLLTDVVLPGGMNGRELTDRARAMRPAIKVLYMTGYTRNAIIHHGRLDPDIDLLTKPFTADALARKIRRIIDGPMKPAG